MDLIIRFLLVGVLSVAAQDMQDILNDVFGTPPPLPDTNERCIQKNGGEGRCMPYNLCGTSNKTIDIQVHQECKVYLDTCCSITKEDDENTTDSEDIYDEEEVGCGKYNPNGIEMGTSGMRTMGGDNSETKFGEFPWIVAVFEKKLINGRTTMVFTGPGSIIHPEVVLTAAHITGGVMGVRAGEWDSNTTNEPFAHQTVDVKEIVMHQKYSSRNMHYDIAMLILSTPLMLTVHVGVVCLPPPDSARTPAGTRCLAAGWGKDKFQNGHFQNILKKVELPVVDRRYCQYSLRRTRLSKYFKLHKSFMCAGSEAGIDTCTGDGGAPLACPIPDQNDRYVQNGIVSWGIGCGENGVPGVYVDVTVFRRWIDHQMAIRNFDTSSYTY